MIGKTTTMSISGIDIKPVELAGPASSVESNTTSIFMFVSLFFFITLIFLGVLLENLQNHNNSLLLIIDNQNKLLTTMSLVVKRQEANHMNAVTRENKILHTTQHLIVPNVKTSAAK